MGSLNPFSNPTSPLMIAMLPELTEIERSGDMPKVTKSEDHRILQKMEVVKYHNSICALLSLQSWTQEHFVGSELPVWDSM